LASSDRNLALKKAFNSDATTQTVNTQTQGANRERLAMMQIFPRHTKKICGWAIFSERGVCSGFPRG
jgi:hypothetical protein